MPADLNWVIDNNWVADYKWRYSQEAEKDIGTPATVDKMFARRDQLQNPDYTATLSERPADMGLIGLEVVDREELIRVYLLGRDLPDEHGANQLEGELKRFIAQRRKISPQNIGEINPQEVLNYLYRNDFLLTGVLANGIADRMKIDLKKAIKDRKRYLEVAAAWRGGAIANGFL